MEHEGHFAGLTPDDEFLEACEAQVREKVLAALHGIPSREARAARLLYERILETCLTLAALSRFAKNSWEHDGATLLRTTYDATLQLLYLLHSPEQVRERAELFLGFEVIDWVKGRRLLDASREDLQRVVAQSPRRTAAEPLCNELIVRVGPHYLTAKGQKAFAKSGNSYLRAPKAHYRDHWYEGVLRDLAEDVGYADECAWFLNETNGSVHSSPFALQRSPSEQRRHMLFMASQLALRAAGAIARGFSIQLQEMELWSIAQAARSWYAKPEHA